MGQLSALTPSTRATQAQSPLPERLVGFDPAGEPFFSGDRVLRGIYPGHASAVREVLAACRRAGLFQHGLVATRELDENPYPHLAYEAVLEHDRVPFVTYPHEWSPSMFKQAALFHIDLFARLHDHGLTLKDWHPYNILFDGTKPVFVDFTSIIPFSESARRYHLTRWKPPRGMAALWDDAAKALYEMYRMMFEPYFGLPLVMMAQGRLADARRRLFETTLNAAHSVISRREAFAGNKAGRLRYELEERALRVALIEKGPVKRRFFRLLRSIVGGRNAAVRGSAYTSYYEEKGEAFSTTPGPEWTSKQRGVNDAISRFRPSTVLDLGSNTGWFSVLAANRGSSVVAVDIDEACIDRLHRRAERDSLPILSLVANLTPPLPELYAREYDDEPPQSRLGAGNPLIASPHARLQCDMVIALAVIHHVALGDGLAFTEIAAILGRLAKKYLCVEFVARDDPMVAKGRGFFAAYTAAPDTFSWYTEGNLTEALKRHFKTVERLPSHPESRTLLVCSK